MLLAHSTRGKTRQNRENATRHHQHQLSNIKLMFKKIKLTIFQTTSSNSKKPVLHFAISFRQRQISTIVASGSSVLVWLHSSIVFLLFLVFYSILNWDDNSKRLGWLAPVSLYNNYRPLLVLSWPTKAGQYTSRWWDNKSGKAKPADILINKSHNGPWVIRKINLNSAIKQVHVGYLIFIKFNFYFTVFLWRSIWAM